MPKFAHAALLTMAMSAPLLAGALMDNSDFAGAAAVIGGAADAAIAAAPAAGAGSTQHGDHDNDGSPNDGTDGPGRRGRTVKFAVKGGNPVKSLLTALRGPTFNTDAVIVGPIAILAHQMGATIMRKLVHATVFTVALAAPVLTGALLDHSAVTLLGDPATAGGSNGNAGAAGQGGISSVNKAKGGRIVFPDLGISLSGSTVGPGGQNSGHSNADDPGVVTGTNSGNFAKGGTGHCTYNPSGYCT